MTGVVAHEAPWPSPNPPGNGICHRKKWRWQGKEMEYIGSLAVKYMFTLHLHIFCPCADHLFFGIYTSKAASGAPLPPIQASNCKDGREFITVLKVPNKMKQVDMYLTGAKKQTSRFRSTWIRFKALRIRDSPRFHRVCIAEDCIKWPSGTGNTQKIIAFNRKHFRYRSKSLCSNFAKNFTLRVCQMPMKLMRTMYICPCKHSGFREWFRFCFLWPLAKKMQASFVSNHEGPPTSKNNTSLVTYLKQHTITNLNQFPVSVSLKPGLNR